MGISLPRKNVTLGISHFLHFWARCSITTVEEVDTVVASETADTDVVIDVVEDAHLDGARKG